MKSRGVKIIICLSVISILVFCVIFVASTFHLFQKSRNTDETVSTSFEKYKTFYYNPVTNDSSIGYSSLPNDYLENNEEFLSYQNKKNGYHVLISKFGTQEYICSGSCVCEKEEERRVTSTSSSRYISKGLVYLVASFSSILAYQKASEYFQSECIISLEVEECTNILSEIDSCDSYQSFSVESEDQVKTHDDVHVNTQTKEQTTEEDQKDIRKFFCYGECLEKKNFKHMMPSKMAEHVDCWNFKNRAYIEVDCTQFSKNQEEEEEEVINTSCENHAKERYEKEVMREFCKKESSWEYWRETPKKKEIWITVSVCLSDESNKSIECTQRIPKLKKKNKNEAEGSKRGKKKLKKKKNKEMMRRMKEKYPDDWIERMRKMQKKKNEDGGSIEI